MKSFLSLILREKQKEKLIHRSDWGELQPGEAGRSDTDTFELPRPMEAVATMALRGRDFLGATSQPWLKTRVCGREVTYAP